MSNRELDHIIENMVKTEEVTDQSDLLARLQAKGCQLTQSTLSRRLNKLGIYKEKGIYVLPINFNQRNRAINKIVIVEPNILVIHTDSGFAGSIAAEIDLLSRQKNNIFNEVLGSIAGDDTIFLVGKDPKALEKIRLDLKKIFI